jgi:hypothetical protein
MRALLFIQDGRRRHLFVTPAYHVKAPALYHEADPFYALMRPSSYFYYNYFYINYYNLLVTMTFLLIPRVLAQCCQWPHGTQACECVQTITSILLLTCINPHQNDQG